MSRVSQNLVADGNAATLTATQLAAPAGGTGATAGAYDSAANRDLAIVSINAARTDIAAIITALENAGIAV